MGFLTPKTPRVPPVTEPEQMPQQAALGKSTTEKFKLKKRAQKGSTILTEGFFDDPDTIKHSLFGD